MNQSYVIGFLVAAGLITLILKSSNKRVMSLMHSLTSASRLIIATNFYAHYKEKLKIDNKELIFCYASAATNYLFSEKPSDIHKTLNIKEIEADAIEFIKQNRDTRELLVQSLRVTYTLKIQKNKNIEIDSLEILSLFGNEFPESPKVDRYFHLVHRELNKLPASNKSDIMNTFPNALNYYHISK